MKKEKYYKKTLNLGQKQVFFDFFIEFDKNEKHFKYVNKEYVEAKIKSQPRLFRFVFFSFFQQCVI